MLKSSAFALLIAVSILSSCGKSQELRTPKKETPIPIDPQAVEYAMNNLKFECSPIEEGNACPSGIARLFILNMKDAKKSGVCTGFLVSKDTLVTNHHCIENQKRCDGTHIAIYNGDNSYLRAKCESVVKSYEDYHSPGDRRRRKDFAVVKLDREVDITPMNVIDTPTRPNDLISAWVVDHNLKDNLLRARISQFECKVSARSNWSALTLSNCPVIGGNSGSPILNENGDVVGLIWGSTVDSIYNADSNMSARRAARHQNSAAATPSRDFIQYL